MHVFQVAFYVSGVYYALFINRSALFPFIAVVALYLVASALLPGAKDLSIRKKIMNATWTHPSEGIISLRVPVRVQKIQKIIESLPKQKRPSLTHFAIKAVGEVLANQPSLNGTLSLGKFVPYDSVDVSCLVDIGGGKDLAIILVKGVDKMCVEEIGEYIKQKASKMKRSDGGDQHKKQMGPFKLIPTFLVSFLVEVIAFVSNKLGISVPMMKIQKHALGAGCVTSLGALGFQDATAPFTGFANCSILLAANAVAKQPVVEGDKVVVGEVMNSNFVVDHRYVDGGNCTKLVGLYRNVFQNPEQFMRKNINNKKQE